MMTLDEAIAHAKEIMENIKYNANTFTEQDLLDENCRIEKARCLECASEHEQLVAWLEELKARREADKKGKWHHSGECPFCHKRSYKTTPLGDIIGIDFTDFCKNCGADLRSEAQDVHSES